MADSDRSFTVTDLGNGMAFVTPKPLENAPVSIASTVTVEPNFEMLSATGAITLGSGISRTNYQQIAGTTFVTTSPAGIGGLPTDHWIFKPSTTDRPDRAIQFATSGDRRTMEDKVRTAVQHAIRACTQSGRRADFDPDVLVQETLVALLGVDPYDRVTAVDDTGSDT